MLAGEYFNPFSQVRGLIALLLATAQGDLGRHTRIDAKGSPVVDHHIEVLLQVSTEVKKVR